MCFDRSISKQEILNYFAPHQREGPPAGLLPRSYQKAFLSGFAEKKRAAIQTYHFLRRTQSCSACEATTSHYLFRRHAYFSHLNDKRFNACPQHMFFRPIGHGGGRVGGDTTACEPVGRAKLKLVRQLGTARHGMARHGAAAPPSSSHFFASIRASGLAGLAC